jgi:hypothetical protein
MWQRTVHSFSLVFLLLAKFAHIGRGQLYYLRPWSLTVREPGRRGEWDEEWGMNGRNKILIICLTL